LRRELHDELVEAGVSLSQRTCSYACPRSHLAPLWAKTPGEDGLGLGGDGPRSGLSEVPVLGL
jgi:hypothetical protein